MEAWGWRHGDGGMTWGWRRGMGWRHGSGKPGDEAIFGSSLAHKTDGHLTIMLFMSIS